MKTATEASGISVNKYFQIISSDEKKMAQVPEELRQIIKDTRSKNSPTRTLTETQQSLTEMFGGKYELINNMGVGSIGECYLIKDATGKKYVAKIIKQNVSLENIETEQKLVKKFARTIEQNPQKNEHNMKEIDTIYSGWKKELNYNQEYEYNTLLADGAKRYKVARTIDISKDGKCIIYEMADGIQADKVIQMVQEYKQNPLEYAEKYKDTISKYKWMTNPLEILEETNSSVIKAFDEQMLFIKKNGKGIMHGDAHTGNIFIAQNENGAMMPTFIDTGNCCIRTQKDIADDLKMFTNYFVGNSKEAAKYYIEHAESIPANLNKSQLIEEVSKELDKNLFLSGKNISNLEDNQNIILKILEERNIYLNPDSANTMKAMFQIQKTMNEFVALSGTNDTSTRILRVLMPDVIKGVGRISTQTNPFSIVKPALQTVKNEPKRAFGTFFQFVAA